MMIVDIRKLKLKLLLDETVRLKIPGGRIISFDEFKCFQPTGTNIVFGGI